MNIPNMKEAQKRSKDKVDIIKYSFPNELKNIVLNKTYFIKTYGCQMNERDSENIKAIVELMGYKANNNIYDADLIIFNTCSIRENANNKVFGMLGRIKRMKQTKKDLIVGICGCMMQEEHIIADILNKYKWIDFVIGTHNLDEIGYMIKTSLEKKELKIDVYSIEGNVIENLPSIRTNKYKAFVNIQLGCNNFCTYCIVPYTRGKQRSRLPKDIIYEIKSLIKDGYKEVTLLGQNVNSYGIDIEYSFPMLLDDVSKTGIERIRFVTSNPWDFTNEIVNAIKNNSNIMPHVHLPVQSGNNEILKLMNRRYTKEEYLCLFDKLKKEIPNIAITTDIIVGFPNETNEQFEDTLSLVEQCKFDLAYTFIFSKRVGTPASKMKDNISLLEKKERLKRLNKVVNKYALENNKKMLNKEVIVLCEGTSQKDSSLLMGYTKNNKLINFIGPKEIIGKIVKVKVTDAKTWSLDGEYIF